MELYAHLIMYYFITATLSTQTAGAYAGPLSSILLFATSPGTLARVCVHPMLPHILTSELQQQRYICAHCKCLQSSMA